MTYQICQDVRFQGDSVGVTYYDPFFDYDGEATPTQFTERICGGISENREEALASFRRILQERLSDCSRSSFGVYFSCDSATPLANPAFARITRPEKNWWSFLVDFFTPTHPASADESSSTFITAHD